MKLEESMKYLVGLQNRDVRIKEIEDAIKAGPFKVQDLEERLKASEEEYERESSKLEEAKKDRRNLEGNIDELEGRVKKSEVKLSNIKSNKEYQAALKEIDDLKREQSLLEDKVIELMEEIEELEAKGKARKSEMTQMRVVFEKDKERILTEMQALDKDLERLEEERKKLSQGIDADILIKYDFLKERKGGLGISSVVKGVCQACHMGIPPQKYNELIRGDVLMDCPNCKRIIYWGENMNIQTDIFGD